MDLNKTPLMIGVAIISEFHEDFQKDRNEDREHIINLSLVIKGISIYLFNQGLSGQEDDGLLLELKEYGKKLWVDYF